MTYQGFQEIADKNNWNYNYSNFDGNWFDYAIEEVGYESDEIIHYGMFD